MLHYIWIPLFQQKKNVLAAYMSFIWKFILNACMFIFHMIIFCSAVYLHIIIKLRLHGSFYL